MSVSYTLKSTGKAFLLSLLLMCLSMHSSDATVISVRGSYTYNNPFLCGCSYFTFDVWGNNRVYVNINRMTKRDGSFVSLLLNQKRSSSYPPLTIAVNDFTMVNSMNCLFHPAAPNTMINYTRGTFTGFHDVYGPQHFEMDPIVSDGFTLYISDVTSTFVGKAYGVTVLLAMININNFNGNGINARTGMYIFRVTANNAKSFIHRSSPMQRDKITGIMQHIGTISVTDSKCENCKEGFYYDFSRNIIEHGLVRFQNCRHTGPGPFYTPIKSIFGKASLQLLTNGNLIISNVTTNGALFGYVARNDGGITSTSRLTLHQIRAASLYPGQAQYNLFASVPMGAQVYLGPMNFGGKDVSTLAEYNGLRIPFTRVTDANRKVRFVASGRARADVGDKSQEGQFSASHCVNDGYSGISGAYIPGTKTPEARCRCNSDRFVPQCTTTWDPLGQSLCPVDTTLSTFSRQCVNCKIDNCVHCNQPQVCVECSSGYLVDSLNKCSPALDNCVKPDGEDPTKCVECRTNFAVSEGGKCVPAITNCIKYSDSGICLECSGVNNFPAADGKSCIACTMEGCEICTTTSECAKCKEKYTLLNKKCVSCAVDNCVRCNATNQCEQCDTNYILTVTFKCTYKLPFCKVANDDGTCDECEEGYNLTAGGKCVPTIDDCTFYHEDGTCDACEAPLTPSADGTKCVNCPWENCAQCNNHGDCSYCKENYTLLPDNNCIECFIEGCIECYEPNVCGHCNPLFETCEVGGKQDTSKGVPWWVWLIVGIAAAVVVGLIIFFIVWCCCCKQEEYFVTYQERYNEAEEKNGDRDLRLWDRNGNISGDEHGAMFIANDGRRPRIFKQDENTTHGEGDTFASSDSGSSTNSSSGSNNSSQKSSSSGSDSSTDSEASK